MEREDLDLLRTLENVVATGPSIALAGAVATPEPPMAEQIVSLIEIVERERRTLVDLQNSEPWTLRRKLDDERWIARQQEILREKIAEIDEEVTRCNEFLAPILSRTGTRITPDNVAEIWNSFVDDVYLSGRF